MELEDRMEYITFSRHVAKEFVRLAPQGNPGLLSRRRPISQRIKRWGCTGPNYRLNVFRQHPEWIKECHDLGMKVNAFPIDNTDDIKWLISQGIDYITTNEPVKLQEIIREKQ